MFAQRQVAWQGPARLVGFPALLVTAGQQQRLRAVDMGRGVVRPETDGLIERGDGVFGTVLVESGVPPVVPGGERIRIDLGRSGEGIRRVPRPVQFHQRQAQVIDGRHAGLVGHGLVQERQSLGIPALGAQAARQQQFHVDVSRHEGKGAARMVFGRGCVATAQQGRCIVLVESGIIGVGIGGFCEMTQRPGRIAAQQADCRLKCVRLGVVGGLRQHGVQQRRRIRDA